MDRRLPLSRTPALVALAGLLAWAGACARGTDPLAGRCATDEDCGDPRLFRCNLETGMCLCRSDEACAPGETCNASGFCQKHIGCHDNRDCPVDHFCDSGSNTCLPDGRCASDLHCKPGELCDRATSLCKPGCRTSGDCDLARREVCLCTHTGDDGLPVEAPCTCEGTTDEERERCPVGRCSSQTCADTSYCGYGEVCREPPEGGLMQCVDDYDPLLRPYCANCSDLPGQGGCGKGPNFCLYSTYTGSNYCGVDCSQGQECPNGYSCADVIVVWTKTRCTDDAQCAATPSDIPCAEDADCPMNGICGKQPGAPTGFCHGRCTFHEGAKQSFCSCIVDEDCAQDACQSDGTCSISRRECDPSGNGCRRIRCVDFGFKGGCLIGRNCKPLTGLTCADLLAQ